MIATTKICSKCHIEKPIKEFNKCNRNKDGYRGQCSPCRKKYSIAYKKQHPEETKKYKQQYYKRNSDVIKARSIEWYKENFSKIKAKKKIYAQKYYLDNIERLCEKDKNRRKNNLEKDKVRVNVWRQNNPDKVALTQKKIYKKRRLNPKFYFTAYVA